ncbi:Deuterolysin metalloprotease family-domain-containing protein [Pterulicium gracile]|uniref:deuterolysin n=1 Tax=Pterulicium gracile TaxID=1884261 RepID=A0A5C3QIF8_9AGAR|nr:Deuterolysin metalloprotease family-domain-containing protein [Pterula gracilis]
MIFAPLAFLALAAGALASPMKRESGLVVSVTAKDAKVQSIADLALSATVKNTGSEDVKILNFATIFDADRLTRSFTITKDGAEVPFTGIAMNVNLELVDDSAFTVIPAGESITVEHTNLAGIYDFESAGTGAFKFEPVTVFQVIDEASFADAKVDQLVELDSTSTTVSIEINDVAKRDIHEKRAVTTCSSNASRASFITASYNESKALARIAASWIASNSGSSLYTAYWGTNSASTIQSRFTAVANENSSSRTLSCTDTYGVCTGGVIAYTVIATTNIYYCSIFFNEVPSTSLCSGTTVASRNVRGGTTLHEMTHAISGTTDVTYGCAADQALSVANKLRNADNYNCFSTQVYANTQC